MIDYVEYVPHEGFIEGSASSKPTDGEMMVAVINHYKSIGKKLKVLSQFSCEFDEMVGIWRWGCDVEES